MPQPDTGTASDLLAVIVGVHKLPAAVSRLAHHALFSAGRVLGADIVLGDVEKHSHATEPKLAQRTLCMVHHRCTPSTRKQCHQARARATHAVRGTPQKHMKCVKSEIDTRGCECTICA